MNKASLVLWIVVVIVVVGVVLFFELPRNNASVNVANPGERVTSQENQPQPGKEEFSIERFVNRLDSSLRSHLGSLLNGDKYVDLYSVSREGDLSSLVGKTRQEFESSFLVAAVVFNKPYNGKKPNQILLKSDCNCIWNCGSPSENMRGWKAYDASSKSYELVVYNCSSAKEAENPRAFLVLGVYYLDENDKPVFSYARALNSFP